MDLNTKLSDTKNPAGGAVFLNIEKAKVACKYQGRFERQTFPLPRG